MPHATAVRRRGRGVIPVYIPDDAAPVWCANSARTRPQRTAEQRQADDEQARLLMAAIRRPGRQGEL